MDFRIISPVLTISPTPSTTLSSATTVFTKLPKIKALGNDMSPRSPPVNTPLNCLNLNMFVIKYNNIVRYQKIRVSKWNKKEQKLFF